MRKGQPSHCVWGKHKDKLWEIQVSQDMMIPTSMKLFVSLPYWRTAHSLSELQRSVTELKWKCSSVHYTEEKIIELTTCWENISTNVMNFNLQKTKNALSQWWTDTTIYLTSKSVMKRWESLKRAQKENHAPWQLYRASHPGS